MAKVPHGCSCGGATNSTPRALSSSYVRWTLSQASAPLKLLPGFGPSSVGEQDEPRVGASDAQFDPALGAERLIGDELEAQFLRVEGERPILIDGRNADELDGCDHASRLTRNSCRVKPAACHYSSYHYGHRITLDAHVIDSLMPDLVGHDRQPSAFLVYLYLYRHAGANAAGCFARACSRSHPIRGSPRAPSSTR